MPEDMEDNGADVSDPVSENEEDSETFLKDDDDSMADPAGANGSSHDKKKYDPKDPSRPRRKKARRACFACQRAHLTCGAFAFVSMIKKKQSFCLYPFTRAAPSIGRLALVYYVPIPCFVDVLWFSLFSFPLLDFGIH